MAWSAIPFIARTDRRHVAVSAAFDECRRTVDDTAFLRIMTGRSGGELATIQDKLNTHHRKPFDARKSFAGAGMRYSDRDKTQMVKSAYVLDAITVIFVFLASLTYYGDFYRIDENKFSFYQKYFYSSVNISCRAGPDLREYNSPAQHELNERIDLSKISCHDLQNSRKLKESYYNGWHDTHPILSTLIGYSWRWGDLTWSALWLLVGSLASLTVLSFYLILRCFGVPWYAAVLLFPATVPFNLLERQLYHLRDFSKVPFILLSLGLLGILFRRGLGYRWRLSILVASTATIAIGTGFRQDTVVLLPAILAGAAFTSSLTDKRGILRFVSEMAVIAATFFLANSAIDLLRTSQVAQLQGYPHFIVQGFTDVFWKDSRAEVPGVSFLTLYSDGLAHALVDANSLERVRYFADMDPKYTTAGFDLIAKYSGLSAADMVTRVFSGLSVISQHYWLLQTLGLWFVLLLVLVAIGKWRLGGFLMATIGSLAASGSIQFSPRHFLHLIMLDRVILVIALAAILDAAWRYLTVRVDWKPRLALMTGAAGAFAVVALIVAAHVVQYTSLNRVKGDLEALPWFPSLEAYGKRFPNRTEAIERFTIDPGKCSSGKLEAIIEVEGVKWTRSLDVLGGGPRSVYFAMLDPAISKATVDVVPRECVIEHAWGPLGDGSIPPLQFFDPEVALKKQSIMRHLGNIASSLL